MLLLYAVRMVRTGVERLLGTSFKKIILRVNNPIAYAGLGITLAIVLQSSAAVSLLVTSFASSG